MGFAVVNFSYRLAPEAQFPSQMEDVKAVFEWARDHATEYGFNMNQLFAIGDSAGAHLLGLYCAACTNPDYAKCYRMKSSFTVVPKAISLACGVYSIGGEVEGNGEQDLLLMEDLLPGGPTAENLKWIDVLEWITPAFPETFLFTATGDFLETQSDALEATLRSQKVPHVMRFYGDAEHSLGHVFHCDMRMEAGKRCNREQCQFFRNMIE